MKAPPSCAHCGSAKFELIRYRAGLRQFCKKKCRDAYNSAYFGAWETHQWYEFLSRPK